MHRLASHGPPPRHKERSVIRHVWTRMVFALVLLALFSTKALASEADLEIPDLRAGHFNLLGFSISAWNLLFGGAVIILGTVGFSLYMFTQIARLPAHKSMLDVAETIFQTCKTYLLQQGKFLVYLFLIIGSAMAVYYLSFPHKDKD